MTLRAKSFVRILLAAALLYGSGAHWLVVQGAAWAGMVAARSGRNTVSQALKTTFDGQHPCRVCLIVKHGADAPPRAALPAPTVDFAFVAVPSILPSVAAVVPLPSDVPSFSSAFRVPPSPPPNILLAA
ncbi:MAG: hypothetical protein ACHQ51_02675 [Elusimicrobiota bacterium]